MVAATARDQPDKDLIQYAREVNAEMRRRGLIEDDGAVAQVVVRGEVETIALHAADVERLRRCLKEVPLFSPSDDDEQRALNARLMPLVGEIASR